MNLQFCGETLNILNRANFNAPNPSLSRPQPEVDPRQRGLITSTAIRSGQFSLG